jgi:hypothetical protein
MRIYVDANQCGSVERRRNKGLESCDPDGQHMMVLECDGNGKIYRCPSEVNVRRGRLNPVEISQSMQP